MITDLVIPTENWYNIDDKSDHAEPSLIGNIVCNAKRYKKFTCFSRRMQLNSLWWNLSNPLVLQKTEVEVVSTKSNPFSTFIQTLPSCRFNFSHYLCLNSRRSPFKQDKNTSRQWCLPTNCWIKILPILKQSKTLSKEHQSKNYSKYQQGSRLLKVKNVLSTSTSYQSSVRFRFNSSDPLWQIHRRGKSRLQSSQERASFLSPFTLFRITLKRLLAWCFKTRQRLYIRRWSRVSTSMSCKGPSLCLSYQSPSRFRVLRPRIYRAFRRQMYRLCHCRQDDQNYKEQTRGAALPQVQKRLGSSRILLYSISLEATPPICSPPPHTTRKRFRATDPFHYERLRLSSTCNQSAFKTRKYLVFLPGSGSDRKHYQRTQRELCLGKNSDQQLFSQSGIFLSPSFCLQYRQLVQANLFASEIPACYTTNYTDRTLSFAGKISQIRKQKCAQVTGRVYFQTGAEPYYTQN